MRLSAILITAAAASTAVWAEAPAGYYNKCENRKGADLLDALCGTVGDHRAVGYDGLWDVYETSDVYPEDGKVWDMYSTKHWTVNQNRCGNYKAVGDCYNREHSFPKSWFDDRSPMVCDAFHVYPTDGKVNGQRSNYPYGECAGGTTLSSNGGVRALGRLGACTFPGYSGTVFEPDDQYKGDFARTYFYMAAAYNGYIDDWSSPMLAGNSYPVFTQWAINLLLKWHREDPVSAKEIARNDAVYTFQRNRNPFIDHPELAEYIWGNHKGEAWTTQTAPKAQFVLPVAGSTVDMGKIAVGHAASVNVMVRGENLTASVKASTSGTGYTVAPAEISASTACNINGTSVKVTLIPAKAGECKGTLTLTSGTLSATVNLTATAVDGLPAGNATYISETSFTANWTYIGDEFDDGSYMLHVERADGADSITRRVKADEGYYECDGLEQQTDYLYWLESKTMTSEKVRFTTAAPVPLIQLYYDGDLYPESVPGEPSQAYELLLDCENIDTDIDITVSAPFYLSTDKSNWTGRITLSAEEERFYLRLRGDNPGIYSTTVVITSGTYRNDETVISGRILGTAIFFEDFEADADGCSTYNGCDYNGSACTWHFSDAGIWTSDKSYAYSGQQAVRMGKTSDSYIEMTSDKERGIGTVTLWARTWSDSDGAATFVIECSADGGNTWQTASTEAVVESTHHSQYTFTVNIPGDCRIRVQQIGGKRFIIDDINISNYATTGIDGVESDYHSWDAYCRGGVLVIESRMVQHAKVYGVDGIMYYDAPVAAGETSIALPKGLYVVAVEDFTRSVLIK